MQSKARAFKPSLFAYLVRAVAHSFPVVAFVIIPLPAILTVVFTPRDTPDFRNVVAEMAFVTLIPFAFSVVAFIVTSLPVVLSIGILCRVYEQRYPPESAEVTPVPPQPEVAPAAAS